MCCNSNPSLKPQDVMVCMSLTPEEYSSKFVQKPGRLPAASDFHASDVEDLKGVIQNICIKGKVYSIHVLPPTNTVSLQ